MSLSFSSEWEPTGLVLDRHISVSTASACSGYNRQYLRRLLRAGKLKGTKIGPIWLIDLDSLEGHLSKALAVDDRRCGPHQLPKMSLVEVLS